MAPSKKVGGAQFPLDWVSNKGRSERGGSV